MLSPSQSTARPQPSPPWTLSTPLSETVVSFMAMAPDSSHFEHNNIMVITLLIIVIDWLVLTLNSVPLLPLHCFYLAFLTFRLRYRRQPASYLMPVQEAQQLRQLRPGNNAQKTAECAICKTAKPPRYYHCRHCSKCIYRLDHHCDFINNCVGQYNYKVYVHFLVNGFAHSAIVSIIMLLNWRSIIGLKDWMGLFWLVVLPAFFGMYQTGRLLSAFKITVQRNQTLIQSYKQVRGRKTKFPQNYEEYLGKKGKEWLIPTFVPSKICNLFQPTFPLQRNQEVKEYTYADEYLYGADDDDDFGEKKD